MSDVEVRFDLTIMLPEQDLDLLGPDRDQDRMAALLQSRLHDLMPHYKPTVERRTHDWEIEAQKYLSRPRRPRPITTTTKEN
jgi:hypothetical protein